MAVVSRSPHHGMPLPFVQPPASLCIVRLSAIGDTCHTVPVIRAIQDTWPSTRLTWIIGKTEHSLLNGLEGVELIVLDKAQGLRGYAAVHRALGRRKFDALLHMHASARANMVSLLVRSPLRIGFDRARARDQQWLFTNTKLPARSERHVMDGLFEFAELLGVPNPRSLVGTSRRRRRHRRHRAVVREGHSHARDQPVHGPAISQLPQLAPGVVCRDRRLRGAALWRLRARDGGQHCHRAELWPRDRRRGPFQTQNLIGKTTLKQLLAILARATVVLCPDSGPAHMATAVGTPVVGLYATSNRHRTGPYYSQRLVVDKYPEAVAREFGRPVESLRWGQRVRDPAAMSLITVADVIVKLDAAFAERGIAPFVEACPFLDSSFEG